MAIPIYYYSVKRMIHWAGSDTQHVCFAIFQLLWPELFNYIQIKCWICGLFCFVFNIFYIFTLCILFIYIYIYIFFFFFFFFFGPYMRHIDVPGKVSNWSCSCHPTPQPQQCRIWAASATYITAHSNIRSLTHWPKPRSEPASSRILVGFVTAEPQWELPQLAF